MRLSLSLNEMKLQVTVCTQGDDMLRTAGAFILLEAIKLEFTCFTFCTCEVSGLFETKKQCFTLAKHIAVV